MTHFQLKLKAGILALHLRTSPDDIDGVDKRE